MAEAAVSDREERILGIIETARAKRPRFKDATVTMAHGAGGKATQTLIEGLLVPALGSESLRGAGRLRRGRGSTALGLAMSTDSFVVRPMRFPGGSIGELAVNGTVNDLAMAGARPQALSLSLVLEEGLPADQLRAEVEAIAAAAEAAGVEVVTGDTKVVERGHADEMYICTAGIGRLDQRAALSTARDPARGPDPRLRLDRRARDGDHARARRVRARVGGRLGHPLAVAGRRRPARCRRRGPALHARRDQGRGRLGPQRARPRLGGRDRGQGGRRAGRTRRSPAPPRCSGSTRCTSPTRASSSPSSPRSEARRRSRALRAVEGCEEAAEIGEVQDGAAGNGPGGDRIRRQAGDGHARRRPPAEDLLMRTLRAKPSDGGDDGGDRVRT